MKLNPKQVSHIKQTVRIGKDRLVVRIDVSEEKNMLSTDSSFNIYCIDKENEIIWQVRETKTQRPYEDDMFVYLGKNDKGELVADRFSGFEYKIDPENGEAEQLGFHK